MQLYIYKKGSGGLELGKEITQANVVEVKCRHCKYWYTCSGLAVSVRLACEEWKYVDDPGNPYSSNWSEMSYYRERALGRRSMQKRLRDGE